MKLKQDYLERLTMLVANPNNTLNSITFADNLLVVQVRDCNESYFANNFEEEIFYTGSDDPRRIDYIEINTDNGDFKYGHIINNLMSMHTFESYTQSNKQSVSAMYFDVKDQLENMIERI